MKKQRISIILLLVLSLIMSVIPVSASDYIADVVVSLQIDNPIMEVNGATVEIDASRGTTPVINDGRTLVPIRAIIEAFGGTVGWDGNTSTAILDMGNDTIKLTINKTTATLNNQSHTLDVAPKIINGRTMLPIRFVAEGFNLGVAWDGATRTVSIIRNSFEDTEYNYLMSVLPAYAGKPYATINNNKPLFKEYEIIDGAFEYYSTLDALGRCDVCMASIDTSIMPTGERESISSVTPSGWLNKSYDNVDGGYLYNRCHLIGYQLTGENANKRNLITGTRYLNVDGMLPFENMVDDYIERTGNSVMYRSTPVFTGNNLVADGVLIEAYSIEDNGTGISFCVYCYNVQPDITINYATGASSSNIASVPTPSTPAQTDKVEKSVYRTPSGKRYHYDPGCGGKNSYQVSMSEAIGAGLTPCQKCAK